MIRSSINTYPLFKQLTALKRSVNTSTGDLTKNVLQIGMGFLCFDLTDFDLDTGLGLEGTDYENFALCDGQDGRPDLKGLFIVGYDPDDPDYDTIGTTGGEKEVTLTEPQLPTHVHPITGSNNGSFAGFGAVPGINPGGTEPAGDTDSAGGDEPHENRPPYYVAAYVMRYQ